MTALLLRLLRRLVGAPDDCVSEATLRHHLRHELSRGVDLPAWPDLEQRVSRMEDEAWAWRDDQIAAQRKRMRVIGGGRGRTV